MEKRLLSHEQHQLITKFKKNMDEATDLFDKLLSTVKKTKAEFEGNIYYNHKTFTPLVDKTRQFNLAMMSQQSSNMLEIGFNAGHSAAIALLSNPNLKLTTVDIGRHSYVRPCYDVLREYFGDDRVQLLIGDSTTVLPAIRQHTQEHAFDLILIDGSNDHHVVNDDIYHSLCLAGPYAYLILNDVQKPPLSDLWHYYTNSANMILPKLNVFPGPPHAPAYHAVGVVNTDRIIDVHNVYIEKSKEIHVQIENDKKQKHRKRVQKYKKGAT
jgi:predicted O-methyltransferase YrrM